MGLNYSVTNLYNEQAVVGIVNDKPQSISPLRSIIYGDVSTPINGNVVGIKDLVKDIDNIPLSTDGSGYLVQGKKVATTSFFQPMEFKVLDAIQADDLLGLNYAIGKDRNAIFNELVAEKVDTYKKKIRHSIEVMISQQLIDDKISYWYKLQGATAVDVVDIDWDITAPTATVVGVWGGATKEIDDVIADLDAMSDSIDQSGYIDDKVVIMGKVAYATVKKMVSNLPNDNRNEAHNYPTHIEIDEYKIYKVKGRYKNLSSGAYSAYLPDNAIVMLETTTSGCKMMFCSIGNFKANFTNEQLWFDVLDTNNRGDAMDLIVHSRPLPFVNPAAKIYKANMIS